MANKEISAILSLKDKFTGPFKKVKESLKNEQKALNQSTRKIMYHGKKVEKAGKTLSASVTAPLAAIGVASVKTAADFEAGMSGVKAISGATEKQMKKLEDKAVEMGKKTKFSASESADAFKYMAMAGWKTKDMLAGIEGIMYLAGATGEDLGTTSDIVTDSLTAFGMSAKETNRFVDVLAKTANKSNTDVGKMGETFKYLAPTAGALGYSVEDVSVAMGLMANAGIKASSSGTAMRSFLTNLAKPTKSSAAAMDALGISMTDSSGKMKPLSKLMTEMRDKFSGLTEKQKAQYAASLAGKTGMSGLLAIVNSSSEDFEKLTKEINNSSGAAKKMYDVANDNLNGSLTILKSTVESCAIQIGKKLSPYIKRATKFITKLADKFSKLSDEQLNFIIKIAGVAAAIGPVLVVVGKLIKGVAKVRKAFKTAKTVFSTFGKASSLLRPKLLIIVAVIALVAGAVYLIYKNWDKIKPFFKKVANWFKSLGEKIKDTIEKIKGFFVRLKDKIKETVNKIKSFIQGFADKMVNAGGVVGAVVQNIRNYISGIKQIFSGIITFIKGVFTGNWQQAWQGVVGFFKGIFSTLSSYLKAPLNAVIGLINGAIKGINKINIKLPGGKSLGFNIPLIPYLAKGTNFFEGGKAVINEKGGEIVDLPRGTRVIPHDKSVKEAYKMGQKNSNSRTVVINKVADKIIVREEADIDKIAEKIAQKLEETESNVA